MLKSCFKINVDLTDSAGSTNFNTEKLAKTDTKAVKPGQTEYEASCASCHANAAIGKFW